MGNLLLAEQEPKDQATADRVAAGRVPDVDEGAADVASEAWSCSRKSFGRCWMRESFRSSRKANPYNLSLLGPFNQKVTYLNG